MYIYPNNTQYPHFIPSPETATSKKPLSDLVVNAPLSVIFVHVIPLSVDNITPLPLLNCILKQIDASLLHSIRPLVPPSNPVPLAQTPAKPFAWS